MVQKSKRRLICFTEEDHDDFASAMREEWPTLVFMKNEYWKYQPDRRIGPLTIEDWRKPPRFKSPNDVDSSHQTAWVEPEGWEPKWSARKNENGIYIIENEPRLQFQYARTSVDSENKNLQYDQLNAYYDSEDDEHRKFVNAAWRTITKLATNKIDVYPEPGKPTLIEKGGEIWVGNHALEWARQAPDRWLASNYRPHGSPGGESPHHRKKKRLQPILDAAAKHEGPFEESPIFDDPTVFFINPNKKTDC